MDQIINTCQLGSRPKENNLAVAFGQGPAAAHRQATEQQIKFDSIIADLRLDLSRAHAELRSMHRHCAALAQRLEASAGEPDVIELRNQLDAQTAYTRSLLESTSWRITRPLRGLGLLLQAVGAWQQRRS